MVETERLKLAKLSGPAYVGSFWAVDPQSFDVQLGLGSGCSLEDQNWR